MDEGKIMDQTEIKTEDTRAPIPVVESVETYFAMVVRESNEAKARILCQLTMGSEWTNDRGQFCAVVSADHEDPSKVRLTVFDAKGPWGHRTRADLASLVDVILDEFGRSAKVVPGIVDRMTGTGARP